MSTVERGRGCPLRGAPPRTRAEGNRDCPAFRERRGAAELRLYARRLGVCPVG
jgi:hypothetical protein